MSAVINVKTACSAASAPVLKLQLLRRSLAIAIEPLQLYRALTANGTRIGTLLLETADATHAGSAQSMIYPRACLRISGRGKQVRLQALNANGAVLVHALAADKSLPLLCDDSAAQLPALVLAYDLPHELANACVDEQQRLRLSSPFDALRTVLDLLRQNQAQIDADLQLVGQFAFESVRLFEQLPATHTLTQDDFELYLPDQIITVPAPGATTGCVHIRCLCLGDDVRLYHDTARALAELVSRTEALVAAPAANETPAVTASDAMELPAVTSDCDDAGFMAKVEQAKNYLRAGDAFQIVLSRRFFLPCQDPLAAYAHLRSATLSPYLFYFAGENAVLFGASPETAVKVDGGSRRLEVLPIAGTRARARDLEGNIDHEIDARIEAELRLDKKEIAEHMMLVDLARNDVARLAMPGTRSVPELLSIRRYARVMHLVSRVEGQLQPDLDALHALAAAMPMGTLSGAPKLRALEIIAELEGEARSSYGGAIGYINAAGAMDTAIIIRSATVRNGMAQVQAGAGVVLHSDPRSEAQETLRKAEVVLRAIASAGAH